MNSMQRIAPQWGCARRLQPTLFRGSLEVNGRNALQQSARLYTFSTHISHPTTLFAIGFIASRQKVCKARYSVWSTAKT